MPRVHDEDNGVDVSEIKDRLGSAKEEVVRLGERLKVLQEKKESIIADLKKLGYSLDDLPEAIAKLKKKLAEEKAKMEELLKKVESIRD